MNKTNGFNKIGKLILILLALLTSLTIFIPVIALSNEVASIKCHLPQTVTLPYSSATAVPNCIAYGLGWNNFNNGYWG